MYITRKDLSVLKASDFTDRVTIRNALKRLFYGCGFSDLTLDRILADYNAGHIALS